MGCCNRSIKPTASEVVPGVTIFLVLFMITIISVIGVVYALSLLSG